MESLVTILMNVLQIFTTVTMMQAVRIPLEIIHVNVKPASTVMDLLALTLMNVKLVLILVIQMLIAITFMVITNVIVNQTLSVMDSRV